MKSKGQNVVRFEDRYDARAIDLTLPIDLDRARDELSSLSPDAHREFVRIETIQRIAALLRYARETAGLSQSELSRRSGIHQSTISKLEKLSGLNFNLSDISEREGPCIAHAAVALDACGFRLEMAIVPVRNLG